MKIITLTLSIVAVLFIVSPAFGASLGYSPQDMPLTVAPGSTTPIEFKVSITGQNAGSAPYRVLSLLSSVGFPGRVTLTAPVTIQGTTEATVKANLAVSLYAVPGSYTLPLKAYSVGSPPLDKVGSITLDITIAEQCTQVPGFENMVIGPDNIMAKEGKSVTVTVSGTVVARDGCRQSSTLYKVQDEYGTMDSQGNVTLDSSGNFSFEVPVEASREGSDLDGRTYKITVFSSNEAGTGNSGTFAVNIAHDQGQGKALGKYK